ncbi:MAG: hypothetical protein ACETWB_07125 [Anaerolineae bacterium]
MRKNPERMAWTVLLTAFAIFCLVAVGIPLGVRWYIITATVAQDTYLEAVRGTVLVKEPGRKEASGVTDTKDNVPEGTIVKTDATSQATLTFRKDDAVTLGTVTLYTRTEVLLQKVRSPKFGISPMPDTIILKVREGRVRVGVASPINSPLSFEVHTPHAVALVVEGSYSVEVTNDESQMTAHYGRVLVWAAEKMVILGWGERTTVASSGSPSDPMPAAQNLIVNGNFRDGLSSWRVYNEQGVDGGLVDGQVEVVTSGNRQAVTFSRMGEDGNHCETGIIQRIEKDVRDFTSLKLHIDVRLLYQSLSGGGYLSSEFPIIIRLDYKDSYGIERFWTHGFYYQNEDNYPIQNGELILRYRWSPYESDNLMETLGNIRPAYITAIRIYASGWNYQSEVSEAGLIVE